MLLAVRASPMHGERVVLATMLARDAGDEVSKTRKRRGQGRPITRGHADHARAGMRVVSESGTRLAKHDVRANTMGRFNIHGKFEVK